MLREARLRPEYAHLYPMLEPGIWASAAATAEKVAAARLLQLADSYVLHDRVLIDAHFEFRGGIGRRRSGSPPPSHFGRGSRHTRPDVESAWE
jgi:hypothetical protein